MMEGDEVPSGWIRERIVEFLLPNSNRKPFQQGYSPKCHTRPADIDDWGVLKTTAIQTNDFWPHENKELPEHIAVKPHLEVMKGDIIMTCAGPRSRCGVPCLVRKTRPKLLLSGKMYRFRTDRKVMDSRYLMHFLSTYEAQNVIDRMKTGINDSGLNLTHDRFAELVVPAAPLPEQQRIVEKIETLFAELDKGEEALREVQKLLARHRQSVLKAAVTGTLTAKGPTEWVRVVLGDLLADIRYGTAKKCRPDVAGTPVLRIPNVVGGDIDLADLKFTELTEKELEKLYLREGDVLIVRSNGSANLVGRGAIVTADAVGMAYAGYLIRLRLDRKLILPAFLHIVLNSPAVRARIERQAKSTSGVHNLNSAETKAIAFDLPDIDTQAEIVNAVEEAITRIEQGEAWCEAELKRSAALRQSILKDAFSGKLVPQDPSDEPAEKLLERIRAARAEKPKAKRKKAAA